MDRDDELDGPASGLWQEGNTCLHVDVHTSDNVRLAEHRSRGALCGLGEAPAGWRVTQETRQAGASKGVTDKYFYSRDGRKHRSLIDVWRYLNELGLDARDAREEGWLRALNRYGTDCKHWAVACPPPQELPHAPIFTPTAAECDDLATYIERISPLFAHAGICRIDPPPGWRPKAAPRGSGPAAGGAASVPPGGAAAPEGDACKRQRTMGGGARKGGCSPVAAGAQGSHALRAAGVGPAQLAALQRSLAERGTSCAPSPLSGLEQFQARKQRLQLFSKEFGMGEAPISVAQFHALAELAWPRREGGACAEAEFWALLAADVDELAGEVGAHAGARRLLAHAGAPRSAAAWPESHARFATTAARHAAAGAGGAPPPAAGPTRGVSELPLPATGAAGAAAAQGASASAGGSEAGSEVRVAVKAGAKAGSTLLFRTAAGAVHSTTLPFDVAADTVLRVRIPNTAAGAPQPAAQPSDTAALGAAGGPAAVGPPAPACGASAAAGAAAPAEAAADTRPMAADGAAAAGLAGAAGGDAQPAAAAPPSAAVAAPLSAGPCPAGAREVTVQLTVAAGTRKGSAIRFSLGGACLSATVPVDISEAAPALMTVRVRLPAHPAQLAGAPSAAPALDAAAPAPAPAAMAEAAPALAVAAEAAPAPAPAPAAEAPRRAAAVCAADMEVEGEGRAPLGAPAAESAAPHSVPAAAHAAAAPAAAPPSSPSAHIELAAPAAAERVGPFGPVGTRSAARPGAQAPSACAPREAEAACAPAASPAASPAPAQPLSAQRPPAPWLERICAHEPLPPLGAAPSRLQRVPSGADSDADGADVRRSGRARRPIDYRRIEGADEEGAEAARGGAGGWLQPGAAAAFASGAGGKRWRGGGSAADAFMQGGQPAHGQGCEEEAEHAFSAYVGDLDERPSELAVLYGTDIPQQEHEPHAQRPPRVLAGVRTASGVMDAVLRGSLCRHSPSIPGVNYPMLYVGMRNSYFCWHVEDNHLYALNYMHCGAPKVWYGVPAHAMAAFEDAWRKAFPHLFARHPDLPYWKTTIFSPKLLSLNGVPAFRVRHTPGTYVVTLPRAYHAGFNEGFNASESVNFALPAWLPVGAASLERYRTAPRRDSTLLHDALLVTASLAAAEAAEALAAGRRPADPAAGCPRARAALAVELRRLLAAEAEERGALLRSAVRGASAVEQVALDVLANGRAEPWEDGLSSRAEQWKCRECRHFGYFSAVRCGCPPTRRRHYLCLRHALMRDPPAPPAPPASKKGKGAGCAPAGPPPPPPCRCGPAQRELLVRYTPAALRALLARLDPAAAQAEGASWPPPVLAGSLERAAALAGGLAAPTAPAAPAGASPERAAVSAPVAVAAQAARPAPPAPPAPPVAAASSCTLHLEPSATARQASSPALSEPGRAEAGPQGVQLPIHVHSR